MWGLNVTSGVCIIMVNKVLLGAKDCDFAFATCLCALHFLVTSLASELGAGGGGGGEDVCHCCRPIFKNLFFTLCPRLYSRVVAQQGVVAFFSGDGVPAMVPLPYLSRSHPFSQSAGDAAGPLSPRDEGGGLPQARAERRPVLRPRPVARGPTGQDGLQLPRPSHPWSRPTFKPVDHIKCDVRQAKRPQDPHTASNLPSDP